MCRYWRFFGEFYCFWYRKYLNNFNLLLFILLSFLGYVFILVSRIMVVWYYICNLLKVYLVLVVDGLIVKEELFVKFGVYF